LSQKVAILLLQILGQSLQVFQLFIHGLGKLQSLLGAEWGRGKDHMMGRKAERQLPGRNSRLGREVGAET
jgi:hypothetical protein